MDGGTGGLGRVAISIKYALAHQNAFDNILITEQRLAPDAVVHNGQCGQWGYLPGDFDESRYVNLADVGPFAGSWLDCADPLDLACSAVTQ